MEDLDATSLFLCIRSNHRYRFEIRLRDHLELKTPWNYTCSHQMLAVIAVPNLHIIPEKVLRAHIIAEFNGEGEWRLCGVRDITNVFKTTQF